MGKRVIALVTAVALALVGAVLVVLYARAADSRAVAAKTPTTAYVTTALVASGTSLADAAKSGAVVKTNVPKDALPVGALTGISRDNQDLLALGDLAPGTYVLQASFGTTPLGTKAIQVPKGKLAVSVELSDPARVGSFVTPGSRLTIFSTSELRKFGTSDADEFNKQKLTGTTVLLEDVLVIGMGDSSLTPAQQPAGEDAEAAAAEASFLVTVAVSPQDAVRLVHAINSYVLYAGLRGEGVQVGQQATTDATVVRVQP
ncbi:MAG: Flp pilus assembly protein CpaB [Dermatophilaceae bacterium]